MRLYNRPITGGGGGHNVYPLMYELTTRLSTKYTRNKLCKPWHVFFSQSESRFSCFKVLANLFYKAPADKRRGCGRPPSLNRPHFCVKMLAPLKKREGETSRGKKSWRAKLSKSRRPHFRLQVLQGCSQYHGKRTGEIK